jgi:hypothetical protein
VTAWWCDEYGLAARSPDGIIPAGTLARRDPGDESCSDCQDSPDGFCAGHPEFYAVPGAVP